MDTTEELRTISLCYGYGGIERGIRLTGARIKHLAISEIEAYPISVALKSMERGEMEACPIWSDLKTFPVECFQRTTVDLLTGGYPCQPFSSAGKRLGSADPRHLWPYIKDIIGAVRPVRCFFENVEGHINRGLREVIQDLEELGYRTTWGIFSAEEVGAPHQRKRVFILAHSCIQRPQGHLGDESPEERWQRTVGSVTEESIRRGVWPSRPGELQHDWEPPRVVAYSDNERSQGRNESRELQGLENQSEESPREGGHRELGNPLCDREGQKEEVCSRRESSSSSSGGKAESRLGGNTDGSAHRIDRLRLLGNGVVPQTAYVAWKVLNNRLEECE